MNIGHDSKMNLEKHSVIYGGSRIAVVLKYTLVILHTSDMDASSDA